MFNNNLIRSKHYVILHYVKLCYIIWRYGKFLFFFFTF